MLEVSHTTRFLPIHVINPQSNKERAIHTGEELESLIYTFGGEIVERVLQKRENPDNATYIGKGKVDEVKQKVKDAKVDVVVLNAMAKPQQVSLLKKELEKVNPNVEVWDRVDLILHIFDKHASTTEAKLQIELARMRYMGTRIYGMGFVLSRQGGGIGSTGIGETNTELMKRHWRNEMKRINDQLQKVANDRKMQLDRRRKAGFKTVSLVGYTNAGKSSLFNLLTGKKMLVEDALFATLDSSVGKIYLPQLQSEILITDTIGFIRNLPPRLINAFKSTLMESLNADILLHVIDASDPEVESKVHVVHDILQDLGRDTADVVLVFNKIDSVSSVLQKELQNKFDLNTNIFLSVKENLGIEQLLSLIADRLVSPVNAVA